MKEKSICVDSVIETQQTTQSGDSGAIPTSTHQFKIEEGRFSDFAELLKKWHYKSSKMGGGISYNLVLKYKDRIIGGIVIGKMRHTKNYDENAVELRRMVLHEDCPKNTASYFLSKTIWWLKKNTNISIVLTFADLTVGHKGTCYKAANFEFVRETPPTIHVLWKGLRYHPRSLTIDRPYSYELRKAVKTGEAIIEKGKSKLLYQYKIKRNSQSTSQT